MVLSFFATKSLLVARFTGLKQTRFEASEANAAFCAQREKRKNKALVFLLSSFRAARKMPRSPRLAHKAPVM